MKRERFPQQVYTWPDDELDWSLWQYRKQGRLTGDHLKWSYPLSKAKSWTPKQRDLARLIVATARGVIGGSYEGEDEVIESWEA